MWDNIPQFNSLREAVVYFEKYGKLEYFGRGGYNFEYCVYALQIQSGRGIQIFIYDDGKVIIKW